MSIRLKIASLWLPDFILNRELDNVARKTIEGLDALLKEHAPDKMEIVTKKDEVLKGKLDERRSMMANAHNKRVNVLIKELGYEEAVKIGRKSMFEVGYNLGQEARRKLGVGANFEDLELAAGILYKILGIKFKIKNKEGNILMVVNKCALSKYYSPESCMILSAADEGVVRGLNENMNMQFKERITEGASECVACINEVKI
ncbi:MAG TPA: L-2-amino-thiazoline-4-carboxylic acid hydrolase [Methanobacterium sp.]|nr:L-2-amino-thiazoline-4-carboxylic acid hydrolase [Methanobacterium sp.]